ncbi:MAG: hypothetical protein KJZ54_09715 [Phycisphaerales bacterium]|nr:hypothetical protein [Phycisphaerales bacterium]
MTTRNRTSSPTSARRRARGLLACVAASLACALAACNIVAPVFMIVHGPEKTQAAHTLERDRPTVILVDDIGTRLPRSDLRLAIATQAEQTLVDKGVVRDLRDARAAITASRQSKTGQLVPVTEVGKAVNADVVVYASVEEFTLSPDGQSYLPTARLRLKVIDVPTETRLWPEDDQGFELVVTAPQRQGTAPVEAARIREAQEQFAKLVGTRLAQTFFTHEKTTISDERAAR